MADVVAELVGKLGYEVDDTGLKKFDAGTDKAKGKAEGLTKKLRSGVNSFAKWGAAAAAAAAVIAAKLITSTASAADEIAKASKAMGVNAQALQRMRFAAQRSGASTQQLDAAIKKLNVGLVDAKTKGTGPLAEGLGVLGVEIDDVAKLSSEDRIGFLADQLAGVEDQALKSALASRFFGEEAGPALKPLLDEGSEGIKALGDRAEELGGVLGSDALAAGENFEDAILDLKTAAFGAGATLVQGLVPAVSDAANNFNAWIQENDEFIKQDLPKILEGIATATIEVVKFFGEALASVDDFIAEIEDLVEILDEEYGPQIDFVIAVGESLIGVWGDIAAAIGKGIVELLEFVGVIDDADEAIRSIKAGLGLGGGSTVQRGSPGFNKNPDGTKSDNQIALEARQAAAAARKADRESAEAAARKATADAKASAKAARAPRKGLTLADLKGPPKKGGGGSKRVDTSDAESRFGEDLRRLAGQAGATDKAIQSALEASAGALESGAADRVAFEAGLGQLQSLTGADDLGTDVFGQNISDALFGDNKREKAGGGSSPTSGAQFVRIDASFNAPTTVQIQLPAGSTQGMNAQEVAELAADAAVEAISERNRRGFDHYKQAVNP